MSRKNQLRRTLVVLFILVSSSTRADYFVITSTDSSKELAQKKTAVDGGWVLATSLYGALTPDKYSVVRGPFATAKDARRELTLLQQWKQYAAAYVKNAGRIRIGALFGKGSSPAVAAALIGELGVMVREEAGGRNPCEPQEPYIRVELTFMSLERDEHGDAKPVRQEIDMGGLWIIKRTGELQHMRVCWE